MALSTYGSRFRCCAGTCSASLLTISSILIGAFFRLCSRPPWPSPACRRCRRASRAGRARLISLWRKSPEAMESKQLSYTRGITRQMCRCCAASRMWSASRRWCHCATAAYTPTPASDATAMWSRRMHLSCRSSAIASPKGERWTPMTSRSTARVCVIGHDLADKLWGRGEKSRRSHRHAVGPVLSHRRAPDQA